ncbi:D-3-phosphoglycerate dehydrogenase, chloroplastic [Hordeum vulgare]|nr:D-3-phosphoglycerate dehydrogenase, chloroplastic [Hordeum vulgare]
MGQAMLLHVDPARRIRVSRSVTIPSPKVDQAVFFLRNHAVTLPAADVVNASSPMAVGRALEAQLSVPAHYLRVTAHHPEHFFVIFTQPALQVNAVRRGSIRVDGASFHIASWHEHDHASFDALLLHVRVIIEGVLMQFWSVDGAKEILGKKVRVDRLDSRTLERGHTKTFACWVWTNDVANIPTRHTLGVLPRGVGRVEEMEGFSPPDRRVSPPPATANYEMLIHVDRVEDWAPPSPRSSHSVQSRISSSGSDDESKPFPAVSSAPWAIGVEDGQRGETTTAMTTGAPGLVATDRGKMCSFPADVPRPNLRLLRPHVSGVGLLRHAVDRGRPRVTATVTGGARGRRANRRSGAVPGLSPLARGALAAVAHAVDDPVSRGKDHVDDFFRSAKKPLLASTAVDGLAADVHAAAEAVLVEPLEFDKEALDRTLGEALQLDAFSPTLSASASDFGQFNRATPSAARTLEVQLGAVTSRVCQLEIAAPNAAAKEGSLFRATEPPLLNHPTTASRRSAAPPKSRAISTPTRHSARQVAVVSTVPVAQRASLRIVKELGLLGPKEKMTAEVAKALLHRFEEPLTDSDISVIAKLTRLDGEALRVMACMVGSEGIAKEAVV